MKRKISKSTKLLLALYDFSSEFTEAAANSLDAFLLSAGSVSRLRKNLGMYNKEYSSTFQGLCRNGFIKKINANQFLITPKAVRKIKFDRIKQDWEQGEWDGFWRIIAFDIPEDKKHERNIFRSVIKRKGFVGIQNSVFIAPFADLDALAELREELGIEKYVSFFLSKTYKTDDDSNLRKRFDLN
jgi:DNA-binding transcriptional regulator PaaX